MSKISNIIFNGKDHYITSPYGSRTVISTSAGKTTSYHSGTDYGTNGKKIPQYAIENGYVFAYVSSFYNNPIYFKFVTKFTRDTLTILNYQ